jgi:hypothetical protein
LDEMCHACYVVYSYLFVDMKMMHIQNILLFHYIKILKLINLFLLTKKIYGVECSSI